MENEYFMIPGKNVMLYESTHISHLLPNSPCLAFCTLSGEPCKTVQ